MAKEGGWSSIGKGRKIAIIVIAAVCAAGLGLYLAFNSYEAAQKLDETFVFDNFTFTGLYDRLSRGSGSENDKGETVRVAVQYDPGIKITSQNPVDVKPGEKVTFTYEAVEGYAIDFISGAEADGNTLTLENVGTPVTVYFGTHRLHPCTVTAKTADFGDAYGDEPGKVELSAESVWSEEKITAAATPSECFEFVCYTVGKPAAEGGTVVSEEAVFEYAPEDDTVLYANFRRAFAIIKIAETDGMQVITPKEIKAAVGKTAFFVFKLEEGVVTEGISEGAVLNGAQVSVSDISRPLTVMVTTKRLAKYGIILTPSDPEGGRAFLEPDKNTAWEGSLISATAIPSEHWQFLGFSLDKSLDEGGKLLSDSDQYFFELNSHMMMIANFKLITYELTIPECEGLHITSENPVKAVAGSKAEFTYTLDPGYLLDELPEGVTAKNGVITVSEVNEDTELGVRAIRDNFVAYDLVIDDASFGAVTSSHVAGKYKPGTQITLSVANTVGSFRGWSLGRSASKGGAIVSTASNYVLTLNTATTVYANFSDPAASVTVAANKHVVLYFPNGGKYSGSLTNGYHQETSDASFYWCPNALPNKGQFTRDGYILLGYNTKADGTGTFYAPGWNIEVSAGKAISLFCQWEKVTGTDKFTYSVSNNQITLTGYHGTDEFVVIPETISGKKVVSIGAAFISTNTAMKRLYIPRTVTTVAASAVINCPNFKTIYVNNSVKKMPDSWATSCPELQTLVVCAMKSHHAPTACYGTYTIKYDWLHAAPGNRIVIVSGSNSAYGINSPELMSKLKESGYEYNVVNFGQNASCSACFFIEACSALMHPGDILVHEPELNEHQYGNNAIDSNIWTIFEGSYEAFANVDIRHYTQVWSTFAKFNENTAEKAYDQYSTQINRYGDLSYNKTQASSDSNYQKWKPTLDQYDANGGKGSVTYSTGVNLINHARCQELNRVYDICAAKGITVLWSSCVIVKTCLTVNSQTRDGSDQTNYMKAVDEKLHCTRISHVADYQVGREYSYNSNYHITTAGSIVRSDTLARDLVTYFKSNKK